MREGLLIVKLQYYIILDIISLQFNFLLFVVHKLCGKSKIWYQNVGD